MSIRFESQSILVQSMTPQVLIVCLLALGPCLGLEINVINDARQSPSLLLIVNNYPKVLPLTLSTHSYIYTGLGPNQLAAQLQNPSYSYSQQRHPTTNIQCSSQYCQTNQSKTQTSFNGTLIGRSLHAKVDIEMEGTLYKSFPVQALFGTSRDTKQNIDGRVNLFEMVEYLNTNGHVEGYDCLLALQEGHQHIKIGANVQPEAPLVVVKTSQQNNLIQIRRLYLGNQEFNITQMNISLDTDNIVIPRETSNQMLDEMTKQQLDCWFESSVLECLWNNDYPKFSIELNNVTLVIQQDHLMSKCYFSAIRRSLICQFHIQMHDKSTFIAGRTLIRRYPLTFNQQQNTITFHKPFQVLNKPGLLGLMVQGVFGWTIVQFQMLLLFICILCIIKGYHLYIKRLPVQAYSSYGNLISTSVNSIQSQNSERDVSEIDTVKEIDIEIL